MKWKDKKVRGDGARKKKARLSLTCINRRKYNNIISSLIFFILGFVNNFIAYGLTSWSLAQNYTNK